MRRVGVEHGFDLRLHEVGHMLEAADQFERMKVAVELSNALANIFRQITDALKIDCDTQSANDFTQVDRHRLAPRDGQHRALFDHALQLVNLYVVGDHAHSYGHVAPDQRAD